MYNGFCITVFNFLNDHTLLQFSSFGRAHVFGLFRTFDLWIDFVYEQHKKNVRKTKTYFGLRFCCKHSWLDAIWQPDFHRCLILAEILRRLDASWIPLGIPPPFSLVHAGQILFPLPFWKPAMQATHDKKNTTWPYNNRYINLATVKK